MFQRFKEHSLWTFMGTNSQGISIPLFISVLLERFTVFQCAALFLLQLWLGRNIGKEGLCKRNNPFYSIITDSLQKIKVGCKMFAHNHDMVCTVYEGTCVIFFSAWWRWDTYSSATVHLKDAAALATGSFSVCLQFCSCRFAKPFAPKHQRRALLSTKASALHLEPHTSLQSTCLC